MAAIGKHDIDMGIIYRCFSHFGKEQDRVYFISGVLTFNRRFTLLNRFVTVDNRRLPMCIMAGLLPRKSPIN